MFNTLVIRDPLNRVAEAYDLDLQDRPVAVTNLEGQVMRVNYGLGSFVRSITRFDGTTVSNTFDTGGRLTRARYPDSSSVFSWLANDRLVSERLLNPNSSLLTEYAYDLAGNRTGKTLIDGSSNVLASVRYTLGNGDRLAAWSAQTGDLSFAHSVSGSANEPIGTDGRTDTALCWDGSYRLTENGYDALGRRAWTWDGAETHFFVYDGSLSGVASSPPTLSVLS